MRAVLRYARMAPRKVRLVADVIRGLPVDIAQNRLRFMERRPAILIEKLLGSAVANARQNFQADPKNLRIERISVNEGPRLKRWMPRARGVAGRIIKRTSHIEIILGSADLKSRRAGVAVKASRPETKRVEEVSESDLRVVGERARRRKDERDSGGSVRPAETPRGMRRLFERKHGGT